MLPGPVFHFELQTMARRPRTYVTRFFYGSILLWLVARNEPIFFGNPAAAANGEISLRESGEIGAAIFRSFLVAQSVVVLAMTPALFAGLIADERQRKTLHDLLASRLTSGEIVLGKLAARALNVGVLLAIGLPIFSILTFLGGVHPGDVLLVFAGSASMAFFLAALSMLVSVHARRPREAVSLAYTCELAWLFGPPLVRSLMPLGGPFWFRIYHAIRPLNEWFGASGPFFALTGASLSGSAAFIESVAWMIGLQVALGVLFLVVAVARLRPVFRAEGRQGGRLAALFSQKARHVLPRPGCGNDALLWKELFVSRTSRVTKVASSFVFLGVVGLLGYATYDFARPVVKEIRLLGYWDAVQSAAHGELNVFLRIMTAGAFGCCVFGTAAASSSGLTGEREGDTWLSLIVTPLTAVEIVRAKMIGAIWSVRWLVLVWTALALIGTALGAVHPAGFAGAGIVLVVNVWFAAALGTTFSLRARTSARALTATVGSLVLCNGGYLLLCLPFARESSFPYLGVSPFVAGLSLMSYEDVRMLLLQVNQPDGIFDRVDLMTTAIASIIAYGFYAALLTFYLVLNFDDVIDRPRTSGRRRATRPKDDLPGYVPPMPADTSTPVDHRSGERIRP